MRTGSQIQKEKINLFVKGMRIPVFYLLDRCASVLLLQIQLPGADTSQSIKVCSGVVMIIEIRCNLTTVYFGMQNIVIVKLSCHCVRTTMIAVHSWKSKWIFNADF